MCNYRELDYLNEDLSVHISHTVYCVQIDIEYKKIDFCVRLLWPDEVETGLHSGRVA